MEKDRLIPHATRALGVAATLAGAAKTCRRRGCRTIGACVAVHGGPACSADLPDWAETAAAGMLVFAVLLAAPRRP